MEVSLGARYELARDSLEHCNAADYLCSVASLLEVEWLKHMWRPDSFFKNAKAVTFQTMTIPNHYMWLYKDKTILYMVK